MKYLLVLVLVLVMFITASAEIKESPKKSDEVWVCGRWTWTGDVFNRKVYCLEWAKKDCSQRLHKEICKRGN